VRRSRNGSWTGRAGQPDWTGALGHYAGAASRFAAYAVDVILSWGAFTLGLAGVTLAIARTPNSSPLPPPLRPCRRGRLRSEAVPEVQ
jgi:hypothetical protein